MFIQLDKDLKIQDVEDEFSIFYPYLKMSLKFIGNKSGARYPRTIEISSEMKMNNVQELFANELKVFPTFFRKISGGWIEISKESIRTLKEENEAGRKESEGLEETHYEDFLETEY